MLGLLYLLGNTGALVVGRVRLCGGHGLLASYNKNGEAYAVELMVLNGRANI
jgi:hypothetical protein